MGSSLTLLMMTISVNVKILSYQMNFIGIYQRICLKFVQWRRIIGKAQIFIDTSTLLRAYSHAHLGQNSLDMTQESISLI